VSVQAMTYVIEHSKAKGSELLVLLMIANHAGTDEWVAWPSAVTLARETRMSERQVRRILHKLERELKEITVRQRKGTSPKYLIQRDDKLSGVTSGPPDIAVSETPDIAVSPEPSRTVTTSSERERDPAFDALATETGNDLKALTRSAAQSIGVKLAEIMVAEQTRLGAGWSREELAAEIRYRAERYRRLHPDWQLTAPSLAKYWGTLGARPVRIDRPPTVTELRAAIPDDQYEPGEPISEQYARLKRDRSKA
jgi:hypothetical protein